MSMMTSGRELIGRWARCIVLFVFQWFAILLIVTCLAVAAALPLGNVVLALIGTNHLSLGPGYKAIRESCEAAAAAAEVRADAGLRVVEASRKTCEAAAAAAGVRADAGLRVVEGQMPRGVTAGGLSNATTDLKPEATHDDRALLSTRPGY
eukprot:gene25971-11656_t